jgi:hypothetical protein
MIKGIFASIFPLVSFLLFAVAGYLFREDHKIKPEHPGS